LHWRESKRTDRRFALQAAFRRHHRNSYPAGTSSQPRLAAICQVPARAQKIKHWLNVHQRERAIEIGRKLIEKEARKYRIAMKTISDTELMRVSSENGLAKPDDLLAAIGYGKFSARSILARLVPPDEAHTVSGQNPPPEDGGSNGLTSVVRRVFGSDTSAIKSKTMTICWSIGRDVVTRFAARKLKVMLPAARAWRCTPGPAAMCEPDVRTGAAHCRRVGTRRRDAQLAGCYPVKLAVYCDNRPAC